MTESNDYLIIYDGNNTQAPQLAKLGGYLTSSMPATYTAYSGSLTVEWITNSSGVRQGWEGYIMTTDYCPVSEEMSTAEIHVLSETSGISTAFITCPPDLRDTLAFGDCAIKIQPEALGSPSAFHSLSWPLTISNDIPTDSLYYEGDHIITWIIKDDICGYADTCYQRIIVEFPECPDAVDCEGNVYHSVRIGCDCWTQRNLESTKYSDCSDIPCVYEYVSAEYPNAAENVNIFGRLYCFEAAVRDSADNGHGHIQGICPAGWYLPTPEKYEELNTYGANALKSPLYWIFSGGDNTTGFSALPAGYYNGSNKRFEGMFGETYFWSTANVGSNTSISAFHLFLDCDILIETANQQGWGYSVRCIKEKE